MKLLSVSSVPSVYIVILNLLCLTSAFKLKRKKIAWKPKEQDYKPELVDWSSVISGCKASCRFERRLCNFYVRAAAHDSMSIMEGYGGADGSLLLTVDELKRPENNYDNFAFILSKNVLALAKRFDASVADIIAVCGAVATEYLGGPKIIKKDPNQPFLVGRYDKTIPNPANALAPAKMNTTDFSKFAKTKNLTLEEMTALMGSHTLLDEKGCLYKNGTYCNPYKSSCKDILMYSWSNIYYNETCTPKIKINNPRVLSNLPLPTKKFFIQQDMCKFTSKRFRQQQIDMITQELVDFAPDNLLTDQDLEYEDVTWYSTTNVSKNMGGTKRWTYTVHDAWMGKACQGDLEPTDYNKEIQKWMNRFKNNMTDWNIVYTRAYKKMVNLGAKWSTPGGMQITGNECVSGFMPSGVSNVSKSDCSICKVNIWDCIKICMCKTAFKTSSQFYD